MIPLLILILLATAGCVKDAAKIVEMPSPAAEGSVEPHLFSRNGKVWMSWLEGSRGNHAFKFAEWDGKRWSTPRTIVSGVPFFVNWADFPSIVEIEDNTLVAHWLQMAGEGKYAYHVKTSVSRDGGQTWSAPDSPHSDLSENEHGFVSLVPLVEEKFNAVWLDSRKFKKDADPHHNSNEMMLMSAQHVNGRYQNEMTVDSRVCDCCQTDAAATDNGLIVVYRDRSAEEVRDISCVRYANGRWSDPKIVHADNWQINACPVNGPAVAAHGKTVAVAWFTGANNIPAVHAVFSRDGGQSFGKAVRVDGGNPNGRVDIVLLPDESAIVSWMENTGNEGAEIRTRRIRPDGSANAPIIIAASSSARASGFPRMALNGNDVLIAWTYTASASRIKVARFKAQ